MSYDAPSSHYLLLDLESPGVEDFEKDRIFEVAAIVVDNDLNELGRYETVVRPTPESLERLRANDYVLSMHVKSGLYAELTAEDADTLPTMEEAERGVLALLGRTIGNDANIVLAGSGVSRYDHPVINVQMKALAARLMYWEQDPSSARRHYRNSTGTDVVPPKPDKTHRAMADIEDDLRYLKAFQVIYRNAALPNYSVDPQARALTAVSLTEAFMGHDSFLTREGVELATTGTGERVAELIRGLSTLDIAAGFMQITEHLVHEVARLSGSDPVTVANSLRENVLATH